jgi:hypothetical protein
MSLVRKLGTAGWGLREMIPTRITNTRQRVSEDEE